MVTNEITDGTSTSTTSTSSSDTGVTTATSSQFIVGTIPLRNPSNINPVSITQVTSDYCIVQFLTAENVDAMLTTALFDIFPELFILCD